MFKKSLLAQLIDEAVENCYSYGSGRVTDKQEFPDELMVTAEWSECNDPEYENIMTICIFKNRRLILSYDDPETKCN